MTMLCQHQNTATTADGQRRYCTDCGEYMMTAGAAMADSRRLNWTKIEGSAGYIVRRGQVYIGARLNPENGVWMLERVEWCEDCAQFELVQVGRNELTSDHIRANPAYIAPDPLGVPYDPALGAAGGYSLQSKGA